MDVLKNENLPVVNVDSLGRYDLQFIINQNILDRVTPVVAQNDPILTMNVSSLGKYNHIMNNN